MFIYVRIFQKVSLFVSNFLYPRKNIIYFESGRTTNKTLEQAQQQIGEASGATEQRSLLSTAITEQFFSRSKVRRLCGGWLKYGRRFMFHSIRS